jgi:hypothetical protein
MNENESLIQQFYSCFQARDAAGMQRCYHTAATFRDPVFGELNASETAAMWHMLCARAPDLEIRCSNVVADDGRGRAHWQALYTFGQTGRPVHNRIDASFHFQDGLILRHEDHFSFWAWSRQAFGPVGLLLGWTPPFQRRVSRTVRKALRRYMGTAVIPTR